MIIYFRRSVLGITFISRKLDAENRGKEQVIPLNFKAANIRISIVIP